MCAKNAMRVDISYKKKNCKKHKYMEINKHIYKQPTYYLRNKKNSRHK